MTTAPTEKRQLVNFTFFKVNQSFRKLPQAEKETAKKEYLTVIEKYKSEMMLFPYSTLGIRSETDFMIWRIAGSIEPFEQMSAELLRTGLGRSLHNVYSFLSMTKRSSYVDKHSHPDQEGKRLEIIPGQSKYLFVYPFVKTREWYLKSREERQKMMDTHISKGHKYPSVKLNTTYSFGLDDQEFVVAFETDFPQDFLDLVQELREAESSLYTKRDTPTFTCIRKSDFKELLDTVA